MPSCSPVSHGWSNASAAVGLYVGSMCIINFTKSMASGEMSSHLSPKNSTKHSEFFVIFSSSVSPSNGSFPHRTAYRTTPALNTSALLP